MVSSFPYIVERLGRPSVVYLGPEVLCHTHIMPLDHKVRDDSMTSSYPQLQRKTSLPTLLSIPHAQTRARGDSAPGAIVPVRRRVFSLINYQSGTSAMSVGKSSRRKRKVTFKNMYAPDVVPPPKVKSYDELVFTVAGLFHTTSFLHDPEDWGEDPTNEFESEDEYYDPEPPLERSIPLMIAEFLYRSAIYLGYPQGDNTPWLPGFREDKKFSGNDVKRWRRLAHFDWEAEEQEFLKNHPPLGTRGGRDRTESNGHTSVISTIDANFDMHRKDSNVSMESDASQDSSVSEKKKVKLRRALSGWIRRSKRPTSQKSCEPVAMEPTHEVEKGETQCEEKRKRERRHKPVSWLNPPPISSSRDLRLLVDIINSCVYCGHFQFRKRDILRLCNVKI